jgi:hypothetical protein
MESTDTRKKTWPARATRRVLPMGLKIHAKNFPIVLNIVRSFYRKVLWISFCRGGAKNLHRYKLLNGKLSRKYSVIFFSLVVVVKGPRIEKPQNHNSFHVRGSLGNDT